MTSQIAVLVLQCMRGGSAVSRGFPGLPCCVCLVPGFTLIVVYAGEGRGGAELDSEGLHVRSFSLRRTLVCQLGCGIEGVASGDLTGSHPGQLGPAHPMYLIMRVRPFCTTFPGGRSSYVYANSGGGSGDGEAGSESEGVDINADVASALGGVFVCLCCCAVGCLQFGRKLCCTCCFGKQEWNKVAMATLLFACWDWVSDGAAACNPVDPSSQLHPATCPPPPMSSLQQLSPVPVNIRPVATSNKCGGDQPTP